MPETWPVIPNKNIERRGLAGYISCNIYLRPGYLGGKSLEKVEKKV